MPLKTRIAASLSLASLSVAKIYGSFSEVPTHTFDFVVVGENTLVTVLVIEAGVSDKDALTCKCRPCGLTHRPPQLIGIIPRQLNRGSTIEQFLMPRGHVIGGSTSINGLVYTRTAEEEWDRLAKETGDAGWSWEGMQHYFLKNEILTPPADGHDTTGQINPAVHG
ncbi:hypothetical protein MPER_00581, partial [Moniliophthora perniciosa FA553]